MEVGSQVFVRLNLHNLAGTLAVQRGEGGTIVRLGDGTATVLFSLGRRVRVNNLEWLEPAPGTFSRGFAALASTPNGFYKVGMMISDCQFPAPHQAQYQLFHKNVQLLCHGGTGASFYDGINAFNIIGTFENAYPSKGAGYLSKVGLIVCEHIWPWHTGPRSAFHLQVVMALVAQLSTIPKIVVLRTTDVDPIRRQLTAVARVVLLDGADFQAHYQPLRMDWDNPQISPIHGAETAIYIKPSLRHSSWIVNRPLHIPSEVLLHMFKGKQTLFLAAGTCDSPAACHSYLLQQLRLHNI